MLRPYGMASAPTTNIRNTAPTGMTPAATTNIRNNAPTGMTPAATTNIRNDAIDQRYGFNAMYRRTARRASASRRIRSW